MSKENVIASISLKTIAKKGDCHGQHEVEIFGELKDLGNLLVSALVDVSKKDFITRAMIYASCKAIIELIDKEDNESNDSDQSEQDTSEEEPSEFNATIISVNSLDEAMEKIKEIIQGESNGS